MKVAVFCGSSTQVDPGFLEIAKSLGRQMAMQQIELVYGGASIGLMGAVADAALEAGGRVTGVMPDFMMNLECTHPGLTDLKIVSSMHERKKVMSDLAQGFVTLPGGFGTLDELFEIITWRQIRLHEKPIGILNHQGYFDSLIAFAENAVKCGFVRREHWDMVVSDRDPKSLLQRMFAH